VGQRPVGDEEAGEDENRRFGESREMLRPAVTVGVARVGWATGDPHREEGEEGGDEIGARVDGLGDEPEAPARQPGAELEDDEHQCREDGDESGAPLRSHEGRLNRTGNDESPQKRALVESV